MSQFAIGDEVRVLENITARLDGQKAALTKELEEKCPPVKLSHAWAEYTNCQSRPATGKDTLAVYEGQFGQFVSWMEEIHPELGSLAQVGPEIAEEYAGHLGQCRLANGTFNKHVRVLELVFRVLARKARLAVNPWTAITRKGLQACSRRELTTVELRKVCQNANGEMRSLLAIGVYTGMRLKDCAGLRWAETDLVRGIIARVPSKTARRSGKKVVIPIHPVLREILEATPKTDPDYVLPAMARDYLAGGTGKRRIINSIQDHFTGQGVRTHAPGTGPGTGKRAVLEVGFHSLRHSFVSLCREAGTSQAVVMGIVGHSSTAMLAHYTHAGIEAATKGVCALPSLMNTSDAVAAPEPLQVRVKALAQTMTGDNWQAVKAQLLAIE